MSNSKPSKKNTPAPVVSSQTAAALIAIEKWRGTLTQPPAVAPSFADSLGLRAGQALYDWLKKNAPADVFELYRCSQSLTIYWHEFECSGGYVSADANSSVCETVIECANAVDKVEGWTQAVL